MQLGAPFIVGMWCAPGRRRRPRRERMRRLGKGKLRRKPRPSASPRRGRRRRREKELQRRSTSWLKTVECAEQLRNSEKRWIRAWCEACWYNGTACDPARVAHQLRQHLVSHPQLRRTHPWAELRCLQERWAAESPTSQRQRALQAEQEQSSMARRAHTMAEGEAAQDGPLIPCPHTTSPAPHRPGTPLRSP